MPVFVPVLTAAESAARDRLEIDAGTPSLELMRRAGERASHAVIERLPSECSHGVSIFVGAGNNGGDGWIVARDFLRRGLRVSVIVVAEPATPDARAAAALVDRSLLVELEAPGVVIDALLGTGAQGAPRPSIAEAIATIAALRARGAVVVSLDVPSGVDATTGSGTDTVRADLTLCLGHFKRGLLARRDVAGEIRLIEIGLTRQLAARTPAFVGVEAVRRAVPPIGALAWKGSRGRLLIVGGSPGMAGASILAARGAQRSGAGMIRFCAHRDSASALQAGCPEAVVVEWPSADPTTELEWPHAVLIGPGLGVDGGARSRVEAWLSRWRGPVTVDADVFTAFAGDAESLGTHLAGRPAVATPHVGEAARLLGLPSAEVRADPYATAARLAASLEAVVLLKGVPTIVASPDGALAVVARGTPALGTAGSGDVLGGILATLLGQGVAPFEAAASAAWVHGRAAEIAGTGRPVRGVTLADVINALAEAWRLSPDRLETHELALLPRSGED